MSIQNSPIVLKEEKLSWPLFISPCTIKSRSSLLALTDPAGPGKRAVKRLCVPAETHDPTQPNPTQPNMQLIQPTDNSGSPVSEPRRHC